MNSLKIILSPTEHYFSLCRIFDDKRHTLVSSHIDTDPQRGRNDEHRLIKLKHGIKERVRTEEKKCLSEHKSSIVLTLRPRWIFNLKYKIESVRRGNSIPPNIYNLKWTPVFQISNRHPVERGKLSKTTLRLILLIIYSKMKIDT